MCMFTKFFGKENMFCISDISELLRFLLNWNLDKPQSQDDFGCVELFGTSYVVWLKHFGSSGSRCKLKTFSSLA